MEGREEEEDGEEGERRRKGRRRRGREVNEAIVENVHSKLDFQLLKQFSV